MEYLRGQEIHLPHRLTGKERKQTGDLVLAIDYYLAITYFLLPARCIPLSQYLDFTVVKGLLGWYVIFAV